jgi:fido (protein-threonine AMPylation protein)
MKIALPITFEPLIYPHDFLKSHESIHPFTDGNGRSGRVTYHWQMRNSRMADLSFLHAFYYQTLRNCQTPPKNPQGSSS